jgi:ribosome-binding factor A
MKTHRLARVAEVVREVASTTILFEIRDPRVKNVTVTRCEVAADLQHAKVYVSVMGSEKATRDALYGLRNAAGFIQSKLAKRLMTRFLPVLTFVIDEGVKKSIEVARILAEERRLRGEAGGGGDVDADADTDTDEQEQDAPAEGEVDAAGEDAPGPTPPPKPE